MVIRKCEQSLTGLILGVALVTWPVASWAGGWYWMAPPIAQMGSLGPKRGPVTAEWDQLGAFDTSQACERARAQAAVRMQARADAAEAAWQAKAPTVTVPMDADSKAVLQASLDAFREYAYYYESRCIASDDPRLGTPPR